MVILMSQMSMHSVNYPQIRLRGIGYRSPEHIKYCHPKQDQLHVLKTIYDKSNVEM